MFSFLSVWGSFSINSSLLLCLVNDSEKAIELSTRSQSKNTFYLIQAWTINSRSLKVLTTLRSRQMLIHSDLARNHTAWALVDSCTPPINQIIRTVIPKPRSAKCETNEINYSAQPGANCELMAEIIPGSGASAKCELSIKLILVEEGRSERRPPQIWNNMKV